ncbi:UDP-N-acetylmuramoyl-L-alanyl-D-glutamate--2,6-diaminopimelate ligase [candidate division NPL-UPA2 bacterium]|nr:UDP-N-acetylmuramoyl-L-alanyl-D-glutamate--2,6-diaminopimelate ligase [candidate division NPL-UPA2 bacterium]
MAKILRELIEELEDKDIKGRRDIEVRGIVCDSRQAEEGFLFVCIPGFNFDGHAFIPEAIKRGACGVVVEKDIKLPGGTAVIKVANTRYALGILANKFYDHPSGKFRLIGIAGTNGKTTTTHLVREILRETGQRVALLGTIAYELEGKTLPAPWTTPPSLELQSIFRELVEEKIDYVVMEVTSHALELHRVVGCDFDIGVFTNSTRDHLDFHKTMENYLEAKTKLFRLLSQIGKEYSQRRAVINIDDPGAPYIIKNTGVQILTYAIEKEADIRADNITFSWKGLKFNLATPLGRTVIELKLPGKHNAYNALAAIGAGISAGIGLEEIREALSKAKNVPGRFERLNCGQPFEVVVDYAHTPDALQKALETARELARARTIVVFGCGGERDKTKRPLMGEVAASYSDITILTSDNPRGEEPLQIIKEIEVGIKSSCDYLIIEDRFEAIRKALSLAREGDLVLLAGKGHEDEQIIKNKRLPFNDREVVKGLLMAKGR